MSAMDGYFSSFAPMASGMTQPYYSGMSGLPGAQTNPLMGIFLQQKLAGFMAPSGMAPLSGLNDVNTWDVLQNQRFWQQQYAVQQQLAEMDRTSMMQTAHGIYSIAGVPWGADQMKTAKSLSDYAVAASPILSMLAPDLLEQLGGRRGSAVVMGSHMMMADRYRIDPLSGQMGMDAASAGAQAKDLFSQFYGGPTADLSVTKGITAGAMGQLYEQMVMRGQMPGAVSARDALSGLNRDVLGRAASSASTPFSLPSDLSALSGAQVQSLVSNTEVANQIKSFDSDRIKKTLSGYLDVVNAMKDIFGEMGRPNAPMSELLNALEALTGGTANQIAPDRLNTLVRTTQQLAQVSGVGMEGATLMQQNAAVQAASMGLSPLVGAQATQGALAFRAAYDASGAGRVPIWGMMNPDQLTQMDSNLRISAAASQAAQRAGLALRLADSVGGFASNSEAAQYVNALKAGDEFYTFTNSAGKGVTRATNLNARDFFGVMSGATLVNGQALGLDASALQGMLGQHDANQAYVSDNVMDLMRRSQGRTDFQPWSSRQLRSDLGGVFVRQGVDSGAADRSLRSTSGSIIERIMHMNPEVMGDGKTRNEFIASILRAELGGTEAGTALNAKMGGDEKKIGQFYSNAATDFWGQWGSAMPFSPFAALHNPQNAIAIFNQETLATGSQIRSDQVMTARVRSALAPLNRGTMLSRLAASLQGRDPTTAASISAMLGGVDTFEVEQQLMPEINRIKDKQTQLDDLQKQIKAIDSQSADPAERQRRSGLMKNYDTEIDHLKGFVDRTISIAGKIGVADDTVSGQDTNRALEWNKRAGIFTSQASGISSDKFADFLASDNGKLYSEAIGGRRAVGEELASRVLLGATAAHNLGAGGIEDAVTIRTANQKMAEMARIYTGGSLEALHAGNLNITDPVERQKIMTEVKQLIGRGDAAVSDIDRMVRGGGRQWQPEAMQQMLKAHGFDMSLSDVRLAAQLNEGDLKTVTDYTSLKAESDRLAGEHKKLDDASSKRLDAGVLAMNDISHRTGASLDNLQKAAGVYGNIDSTVDEIRRSQNIGISDVDTARRLAEQYGVNVTDDAQLDDMAKMIHTRPDMANWLISGQRHLSQLGRDAGKRAGGKDKTSVQYADDVIDAFKKISALTDPGARKKAESEFKSRFGLNDADFADTKLEIESQISTRFSDFGNSGERVFPSIEKGTELFSRALAGAQLAPQVTVNYPDHITVTSGNLTITGNTATLQATASVGENSAGVSHVPTAGGGSH